MKFTAEAFSSPEKLAEWLIATGREKYAAGDRGWLARQAEYFLQKFAECCGECAGCKHVVPVANLLDVAVAKLDPQLVEHAREKGRDLWLGMRARERIQVESITRGAQNAGAVQPDPEHERRRNVSRAHREAEAA